MRILKSDTDGYINNIKYYKGNIL
uniref:Uncharacterized protein n=1 Tax=Anguilla anguilla TaxID=7936 RepID=A0A0E9SDZ8_ANGAN